MNRKGILFSLTIVGIIAAIAILSNHYSKNQGSLSKAKIGKVRIQNIMFISGSILPDQEIDVTAHLNGVIANLRYGVGDLVREGTALGTIKVIANPIEYEDLKNRHELNKISYLNSKRVHERYLSLFKKGVISLEELEGYKMDFENAGLDFEKTKNQISIINGSNSNVDNIFYAPITGTITEQNIKVGSSVMGRSNYSQGTIVSKIANMDSLCFYGSVTDLEAYKVNVGDTLLIEIAALEGIQIKSIVKSITPRMENNGNESERFEVMASLIIDDTLRIGVLKGFKATAELTLNDREVLGLNENFLVFENDSTFVFLEKSPNTYEKRAISIGISDGVYSEILKGLEKDDIVVKFEK